MLFEQKRLRQHPTHGGPSTRMYALPFAMQDRLVENKTKREHPQVSLFHVNQFVGKAKALALTETKRKREEVKRG